MIMMKPPLSRMKIWSFFLKVKKNFKIGIQQFALRRTYLEGGFMGYFGMFWTEQAFHEKFFRALYRPVLEAFDSFAKGDEDARSVLDKLKKQFEVRLIHNSLVDLVEHEYLDKARGWLVARMLELMHTEEGLPPCGEYHCKSQREMLHETKNEDVRK
jgi:hypothetical protein